MKLFFSMLPVIASRLAGIALLLLLPSLAAAQKAAQRNDVLDVAYAFEDGGGYNSKWAGAGVPEAIRFRNQTILAKGAKGTKGEGTYCCGFTLTVAMKAAETRGLLEGKTVAEIRAFQKQWYGVPKASKETLCVYAVEQLGIGRAVKLADARPGDFVQFWRQNKSGHSVIFLDWVVGDDGAGAQRVGLRYRSSQGSTKGIGDRVEYFSDAPNHQGGVLRERTHVCRLLPGPAADPKD